MFTSGRPPLVGDTPDVPLPILLHEDQALNIGIIFNVRKLKECSKHQIRLFLY